jgi:hypothetical protein
LVSDFGDFTGDGALDVIVTRVSDGRQSIWNNDGHGSFSESTVGLPDVPYISFLDINSDGFVDLLANGISRLTGWLNSNGTAIVEYFDVHQSAYLPDATRLIASSDLNRDGHVDLVIGWTWSWPGQQVTLLLSDDDGTFAQPITYVFPTYINVADTVLSDIDNDGDLDIRLEGELLQNPNNMISRWGVIVNQADLLWPVGDSNRDGRFDSADLVTAFAAGEYEDTLGGNSTWLEGDWNGDGDFTSADLVLAFQHGAYAFDARLGSPDAESERRNSVPA